MPDILQITEDTIRQASGESISYTIDTAPYPGSSAPTSPVATVFKISDESDVTSTVMPAGTATVSSEVITLKPLTLLTAGETYRLQVLFIKDGNTYEPYGMIQCPY